MATPIYTAERVKSAYHLRYSWTGWPSAEAQFPDLPDDDFFSTIDAAWSGDHLRRMATNWSHEKIQMTFSVMPWVSPTFFNARVKGRLQHALRQAGTPVSFSRKVAFRAIGDNCTNDIQQYIERQVDKEGFVDSRFASFLKQFTKRDNGVQLDSPTATNSGRYWYNLHVVLVTANRIRFNDAESLSIIQRQCEATAKRHEYQLASYSLMPDHVHLAVRGNVEESPQDIALALMNNTAFGMRQNAIWNPGFYAGTFSEYDTGAVRKSEQ